MKEGIVLFAHGSRDPEWSRPFERLAASLEKKLPAVVIAIGYLEHGTSLDEALGALIARGAGTIRVIPVFLGTGGHVKDDLPRLVAAARAAHPAARILLEEAIGEQPQVIEAIAAAIAAGTP